MAVKLLRRAITALLVLLIRIYQNTISVVFPSSCRYDPSCSQYAVDALRKYGVLTGLRKAGGRILRCHPYSRHSSYDPA